MRPAAISRRARRPPTPDYPLGYGKAVFFWSFIVALVLFSLGGLFSDLEWGYVLAFAFFIVMMFVRPGGLLARRQ